MELSEADRELARIETERQARLDAYWREKAAGRVSQHWKSQAEAQAIIAEHGCRLCTWHYPGYIFDVSGDLWCNHCVREISRELTDLEPAHIPYVS